jgi:uncharacterized membrane protein
MFLFGTYGTGFMATYGTGAMLAAVHGTHAPLTLIGVLIVIGCLIAAGVAAFRSLWVAALALLAVAIVAAFLLL